MTFFQVGIFGIGVYFNSRLDILKFGALSRLDILNFDYVIGHFLHFELLLTSVLPHYRHFRTWGILVLDCVSDNHRERTSGFTSL